MGVNNDVRGLAPRTEYICHTEVTTAYGILFPLSEKSQAKARIGSDNPPAGTAETAWRVRDFRMSEAGRNMP